MTNSNMTCEAFDAAFPDYLEGSLDSRALASVEQHLRECVRCASLVRDVENLRAEAGALPDLVPSRDLWAGIEARIAAPVIALDTRRERQKRFAPWMAAAAAALVISTAGVTYMLTARSMTGTTAGRVASQSVVGTEQSPATQPDQDSASPDARQGSAVIEVPAQGRSSVSRNVEASPSGRTPAVRMASGDPDASSIQSERVYSKEIAMLQKIVSERKTQLDPSTLAIIERNLGIIDAAIAQSKAALAKDPASVLLSDQLTHALDKKVELLRTAALLPAST